MLPRGDATEVRRLCGTVLRMLPPQTSRCTVRPWKVTGGAASFLFPGTASFFPAAPGFFTGPSRPWRHATEPASFIVSGSPVFFSGTGGDFVFRPDPASFFSRGVNPEGSQSFFAGPYCKSSL